MYQYVFFHGAKITRGVGRSGKARSRNESAQECGQIFLISFLPDIYIYIYIYRKKIFCHKFHGEIDETKVCLLHSHNYYHHMRRYNIAQLLYLLM